MRPAAFPRRCRIARPGTAANARVRSASAPVQLHFRSDIMGGRQERSRPARAATPISGRSRARRSAQRRRTPRRRRRCRTLRRGPEEECREKSLVLSQWNTSTAAPLAEESRSEQTCKHERAPVLNQLKLSWCRPLHAALPSAPPPRRVRRAAPPATPQLYDLSLQVSCNSLCTLAVQSCLQHCARESFPRRRPVDGAAPQLFTLLLQASSNLLCIQSKRGVGQAE